MKSFYVYILTNKPEGVLYVGVTSDLQKRIQEHKTKVMGGFTARYNVDQLVYFETTTDVNIAIAREKQLKNWHRQWKINLIQENNFEWKDLSKELFYDPYDPETDADPETSSG
jgi:putative endonuclease